jgi:hypothetical protein
MKRNYLLIHQHPRLDGEEMTEFGEPYNFPTLPPCKS